MTRPALFFAPVNYDAFHDKTSKSMTQHTTFPSPPPMNNDTLYDKKCQDTNVCNTGIHLMIIENMNFVCPVEGLW